jgi:CobQ-like glutamine amidotransferase family enzyme/UDP-N-acetylmuramyl tripeptide synthase
VLVTSGLSRRLGAGSGSTIGGRVGLALDPSLLGRLAVGRQIALVSGTNGKTTTTRLLAESLGGSAAVATSQAGANMPAGLVAALAAAAPGAPGVLEVDEGYLAEVTQSVAPRVIVALNLSRDQLDRVGEVRMTASLWREVFATTAATVVANCDDPLIAFAAGAASDVVWVAAGGLWRSDAYHCPNCDDRIDFAPDETGGWHCRCGNRRPEPAVVLGDASLEIGGRVLPFGLALPGRFNRANAAMAAAAAAVLGVDPAAALRAMSGVEEVAGRFAAARLDGREVRLLLAKNPAGWTELVELIASTSHPVVVAINARDADGHDPSWLWDVPFERLAGRLVVATGERRHDLAVRLRHAGLEHLVVEEQPDAIRAAGTGAVEYVGNYTAFQQLRQALARARGGASGGSAPRGASANGSASPAPTSPPLPALETPVAALTSEPAAGVSPARQDRSAARPSPLSIVVVHPDLLGTYGDAGNGIVLANRARWRDIPVELVLATSDQPLPRSGDLYCLGGGEDGPQTRSAERLADGALATAAAAGAHVLAVCAGFQILGTAFPGAGGRPQAGLGLLDVTTVRGEGPRFVGEVVVEAGDAMSGLPARYRLSGFENHAGVTRLGPDAAPLGRVLVGSGNGAEGDAVEGAVMGNLVATYLHGPVLARNPAFADVLLAAAIGTELAPLDDSEEDELQARRLEEALDRLRPAIRASGRVR